MAFDIRSSSAGSPATGTKNSSSTKNSSPDLFARDLAAAARSAQKSAATRAAAAQTQHTSSAPKPASTHKQSSSSKPQSTADDSDRKSSSSAAGKSSASGKSGAAGQSRSAAAANAAARAQSGQDGSGPDDAAAADADSTATNGTAGSKGRLPTRAQAAKTSASQSVTVNTAGNAIPDPSAGTANQTGMSLLQLLAQSLQVDDSAEPATDSATPAATDKSTTDGAETQSNDPNAIALAMFTQALAAALGTSTAAQQTQISNTASATTGDAAAGIADATRGGASMQDLMSVLAQNVAAEAKGNSDAGASQFNVDPTKSAASDTSAAVDTAAAGPNSLAHLGVASHFSAQHLRNDTNLGDLKSPVGSRAWDDELGTQLTWMTHKGLETGSLRVSPEHLGPVEVTISVQNGAASVWFGATHPDTRAALEQALPRLREMFASQGMNLTDSGVSRESPRNQSRSTPSQSVSGVSAVGSSAVSTSAALRMSLGLVDTYA